MDPSVSEFMKSQFRSNLPKSKKQITDTIERLWKDPNWLAKIKNDMTRSSPKKIAKAKSRDSKFEKERQSVQIYGGQSQSRENAADACLSLSEPKAWWEQAAEKTSNNPDKLKKQASNSKNTSSKKEKREMTSDRKQSHVKILEEEKQEGDFNIIS
jgi:hypothetical protein